MQTATFDAAIGNTEGGVTNLSIKSGTNSFSRHGLLRQDAEVAVRQRFLRQRQQHPARRLHLQPLRRHRRRPDVAAGSTTAGTGPSSCTASKAIHEARPRNNGTPTVPTAKMRKATSRSCSRSGRSIRFTTRSRGGWPPGGRVMADPFPGNIIPPQTDQPGGARRAGILRHAEDGRRRRRDRQLPEPVAAGNHQVRLPTPSASTTT